jgi:hypothetical protein
MAQKQTTYILQACLLLCLAVPAAPVLESWHYRAVRARSVEDCTAECDEDDKCRTWIYNVDTRECRLNEYIHTAKNIHVARDTGIIYVSGVKHGKKRLRVRKATRSLSRKHQKGTMQRVGAII